jgi:hypothetical protein
MIILLSWKKTNIFTGEITGNVFKRFAHGKIPRAFWNIQTWEDFEEREPVAQQVVSQRPNIVSVNSPHISAVSQKSEKPAKSLFETMFGN